jgi:hypothetical protein
MSPEQFEQRARSCRTRQDLEQLKANALSGGRKDFAEVAHRLLDELFPVHTRKGGGATPSAVTFKGKSQRFLSGKEGYVWLVDQFGLYKRSIFAEYEDFHRKRKSSGCRLAQTPDGLFPAGSSRAGTASNYAAIVGGWYVDANLNHVGKFALLLQLGYLAKLQYPTDWNFEIEGSTEDLAERQKAVIRAEEILHELLAM